MSQDHIMALAVLGGATPMWLLGGSVIALRLQRKPLDRDSKGLFAFLGIATALGVTLGAGLAVPLEWSAARQWPATCSILALVWLVTLVGLGLALTPAKERAETSNGLKGNVP